MAEEHRCQEAPRLCVNNCGFFGSPATQNLCSKCYRDLHLKHPQPQPHFALPQALTPASSSSASIPYLVLDSLEVTSNRAVEEAKEVASQPNRCLTCRKKVGVMGFKCRCGMVFCGTHRYPEKHDCGFDFKSLGKQQIAMANPVIKSDKLQKI